MNHEILVATVSNGDSIGYTMVPLYHYTDTLYYTQLYVTVMVR